METIKVIRSNKKNLIITIKKNNETVYKVFFSNKIEFNDAFYFSHADWQNLLNTQQNYREVY